MNCLTCKFCKGIYMDNVFCGACIKYSIDVSEDDCCSNWEDGEKITNAIKMLEAKLKCMTRETSGINENCNCKLCESCSLNYEQGNIGEQKEAISIAIYVLKNLEVSEDE